MLFIVGLVAVGGTCNAMDQVVMGKVSCLDFQCGMKCLVCCIVGCICSAADQVISVKVNSLDL